MRARYRVASDCLRATAAQSWSSTVTVLLFFRRRSAPPRSGRKRAIEWFATLGCAGHSYCDPWDGCARRWVSLYGRLAEGGRHMHLDMRVDPLFAR